MIKNVWTSNGNKKMARKERMSIARILNVSFHEVTKALKKGDTQPDELRKRALDKMYTLKEAGNVDQK